MTYFYMTREDEQEFLEFVQRTGKVVVLPSTSPAKDIQPVKALPEPFSRESWFSLYLHNRDVPGSVVVEYLPQQKYYVINKLEAPVVEFSRSVPDRNIIHPGRIWAQFAYLDKKRMIMLPKDPLFKSWYETIALWLRKNYVRIREGQYAGSGARSFTKQGGTLAEM